MELRRIFGEFVGTLALLLVVVGSGIMGEKLAAGNLAIALLANAIATGCGLFVLISIFGPVSGAHFNPVVSTYARIKGELSNVGWFAYIGAQIVGAILGVFLAHFIFELPVLQISEHPRDGAPQMLSEVVATVGLLLTISGFSRHEPTKTPIGVALYIVGAYWFTSSTSFANPAVTLARSLTATFAGIAPHSLIGYIVAQILGLFVFTAADAVLLRKLKEPEIIKEAACSESLVVRDYTGSMESKASLTSG